jgi:hypothetical protein
MSGGRSNPRTPALPGQGKSSMLVRNKDAGIHPGRECSESAFYLKFLD